MTAGHVQKFLLSYRGYSVPFGGTHMSIAGTTHQQQWITDFLSFPYSTAMPTQPVMQPIAMGGRPFTVNKNNSDGGKLRINRTEFEHGVAVQAQSCLRIYSPEPIRRFSANVGSGNDLQRGSILFYVKANDVTLNEPLHKTGATDASQLSVMTRDESTTIIELCVDHQPENPIMNNGVWADAVIETISGNTFRLDEIEQGIIPCPRASYPITFTYDGQSSDEFLPHWHFSQSEETVLDGKIAYTVAWQQPDGGLKVSLDILVYQEYPALEILPWFENTSGTDTGVIANIQSVSTMFEGALPTEKKDLTQTLTKRDFYRLHKTRRDGCLPDQYMLDPYEIDFCQSQTLGGGDGRCSSATLPFFKVDTSYGAIMFGLGWMGQWAATLSSDGHFLNFTVGQELTHFKLYPGERIRQVRVLILNWEGDNWEANAQFRQLLYKHHIATLDGRKPLPRMWVLSWAVGINCFQDTSAENIDYINAYGAKLHGLDAYVTDAGWFKGGFCTGEGNYLDFDENRWPQGVAPVLAAAKKAQLWYGLWFDIERTAPGSQIHREHRDWLLADHAPGSDEVNVLLGTENPDVAPETNDSKYLRWFGNPDVVTGTYEQTAHYLKMDGFNFYRQDFNMAPLSFWRCNDTLDRQGMHEILHVMGLLQFWHMLADNFPGALLEECSGGGGRIDLDTISVMHLHQKSDLHSIPVSDQSALMGLSHFLPNNCFHGFVRVDGEYAFRSLIAGSLCHGLSEIINADFDPTLAQRLIDEHHAVRHLLIDAWYPITAQTLDQTIWLASQYHRKDLDEGMVLAFRREDSPFPALSVNLRQIDADAMYQLKYFSFPENKPTMVKGSQLLEDCVIEIPRKKASEIMTYKKMADHC